MRTNGAQPAAAYEAGRPRPPALAASRQALLQELRSAVMDDRVVDAMGAVPREAFVPPEFYLFAYDDRALSIGAGQTISQPLMVATMTSALRLRSTDRVLEVGAGSGYQAAVLARLARRVVTVERVQALAAAAAQRCRQLGYDNVEVRAATDVLGWPEGAPYDAILVAAGAPKIPQSLMDQLALGGRLVIPVGTKQEQALLRVTRPARGDPTVEDLGTCQFVPLIGPDAWPGAG